MPRRSQRPAQSDNPSVELPTELWQYQDRVLERFAEAWRSGQRPSIDDYLKEMDGERHGLLIELVHQDLACRMEAGEASCVESYLERYPQLAGDGGVLLDLLADEYLLRQGHGEAVTFEEYRERFGEKAAELERQAALRQARDNAEVRTLPPPTVPPEMHAVAPPVEERLAVPPTRMTPAGPAPLAPLPATERLSVPGYEVLGVLGRGAMGVVYQARQLSLGRTVALKVVRYAEDASEEERRRFRAEAEAIARLKHANVVQVHEVGESNGLPFFVMEYCEGGRLDTWLGGAPLLPAKAAALVQTLATAIHAAHQVGVVHRDLKPANVLLTADGTPKVSDFGLAKRLDVPGHTQTGAIMGTPCYMAPEQAAARKDVGQTADVWALGAVLYEFLTGRPPFQGATVLETLEQVLTREPVAVRRLQPKVSRDLETICHKCLQKEPSKRYASAAALAEDLRRFAAGEPVVARPVGAVGRAVRWSQRHPAVAALLGAVAVVAAAGLGGILWAYGEAVAQRNSAKAETQRADEKAAEANREVERAGRQEYLAQIGGADAQLQARDHAGAAAVLESVGPHYQANWEYRYLRRKTEGTPLTLRGHTNTVFSVAYSPDGTRLASGSFDGTVKVWDARSGAELATLRGHAGAVWSVCYSPEGTHIASASADRTIKVWDATSGAELVALRGHTRDVHSVCYSPDGTHIVSTSDDKTINILDTKSGATVVTSHGTSLGYLVAYSPDGTQLVSGSLDGTVKVWDARSGAELATLRGHAGPVLSVSYSPDGTRIASASGDAAISL
jgi:predicted Ser/Thr protein kinase